MKQWNFSTFSLSAFKFNVPSFDIVSYLMFSHSLLGPYFDVVSDSMFSHLMFSHSM
jgi:hypothetical protein